MHDLYSTTICPRASRAACQSISPLIRLLCASTGGVSFRLGRRSSCGLMLWCWGLVSLSREVFECRIFAIVYTRWKQCPRTRSDGAQRDGGTGPNNALRAGAPQHAALHVPQGRRQYSMLSHMLHSAALQPLGSTPLCCTRHHVCDNSRPRLVKQPSTHAAVPAPPAVDPACTRWGAVAGVQAGSTSCTSWGAGSAVPWTLPARIPARPRAPPRLPNRLININAG